MQDSPKKSGSDAVLNADVKKPTDEEITTPKSIIIDALVKTTDLLASATVSTFTVETTTKVSFIGRNCMLSLCTGK